MKYEIILEIIESFYEVAKKDILIGYHFRVIEDFDEHIPKIADFWNLQINGEIKNRNHLPFDLLGKHIALNVNLGEVHRWEKLFNEILDSYNKSDKITKQEITFFKSKVEKFKMVLVSKLF